MEELDSVSNTVEWLQSHSPDLIFLDIHLSDGSGFEIFDHTKVNAPVIFTTAYDQYAIQAFKVNSIDYLLKPVKKDELQRSLDQFKEHYRQNLQVQENIREFLESVQGQGNNYKNRLLIHVGEKLKSIPVTEMAYFYAENKVVMLKQFDGTALPVDYSLDKLGEMLDPHQFYRINRQMLINFDAIKQMHQYPKGRVKIDLNPSHKDTTIVSVERAKNFKAWLEQ